MLLYKKTQRISQVKDYDPLCVNYLNCFRATFNRLRPEIKKCKVVFEKSHPSFLKTGAHMKYILLLRGINVGGNHHVDITNLKNNLAKLGLKQVVSHINSGNLLFTSELKQELITTNITNLLAQNYDFEIGFILLNEKEWAKDFEQQPLWFNQDKDLRHNVLFKLPGYHPSFDEAVLANLKSEFEQVKITDTLIYWTSPKKLNYSSGSESRIRTRLCII